MSQAERSTQAILDATRSSISTVGVRRTTLTDIARRAGVSRMTVYRHYPDVAAILRELMTREFGGLMEQLAAEAQTADGDGRTRTTALVVAGTQALRAHPVLHKVLESEPELLLPYLLGRMGDSQRLAHALLVRSVADGQADGSIRAGDPALIAAGVLLVAQAFLYSGDTIEGVAARDLDVELRRLVSAALAPGGV